MGPQLLTSPPGLYKGQLLVCKEMQGFERFLELSASIRPPNSWPGAAIQPRARDAAGNIGLSAVVTVRK